MIYYYNMSSNILKAIKKADLEYLKNDRRQYYQNNKEYIKEQNKKYYHENKERIYISEHILKKMNSIIECKICDKTILYKSKYKHNYSQKHIANIERIKYQKKFKYYHKLD